MSIKYPRLNNNDIISLIDCVRVIPHKDYPASLKNENFPRGHDLLEEIKERLRAGAGSIEQDLDNTCKIDLTYLFKHNHELSTYIRDALDIACDRGLSFSPRSDTDEIVPGIMKAIEEFNLIARVADESFVLYIAPNVTGLMEGCPVVAVDEHQLWAIYKN